MRTTAWRKNAQTRPENQKPQEPMEETNTQQETINMEIRRDDEVENQARYQNQLSEGVTQSNESDSTQDNPNEVMTSKQKVSNLTEKQTTPFLKKMNNQRRKTSPQEMVEKVIRKKRQTLRWLQSEL